MLLGKFQERVGGQVRSGPFFPIYVVFDMEELKTPYIQTKIFKRPEAGSQIKTMYIPELAKPELSQVVFATCKKSFHKINNPA
jgi:hypothetical protein